jgi:lipopolysaccharide/colanic/teichoic acid biosynthesis glycosyltransferase
MNPVPPTRDMLRECPTSDSASLPLRSQQSLILVLQKGLPRFCEVLLAFLGLSICFPLLVLASLAIRISSRGPIIFRQKRVGLNGEPFTLYKLRTMRNAGKGLQVTASDDQRVTGVGRILRKLKLDELPELWNVMKGDMGLVGPRPEVGRYVDRDNPTWKLVLRARPGITDPVTLRLRNEEMLLAGVESDRERFYLQVLQPFKLKGYLEYLQQRSWRSDLRVLYHTAIAVVLPNSVPLPTVNEITMFSNKLPWRNI